MFGRVDLAWKGILLGVLFLVARGRGMEWRGQGAHFIGMSGGQKGLEGRHQAQSRDFVSRCGEGTPDHVDAGPGTMWMLVRGPCRCWSGIEVPTEQG